MYISFVASPLMKYKISTSLGEIKAIFNKKIEYPLYIYNINGDCYKHFNLLLLMSLSLPLASYLPISKHYFHNEFIGS